MHALTAKIDFVTIQARDILQRINRMIGHNETTVKIGASEVVFTFTKETSAITKLLSIPTKIGAIPVTLIHRSEMRVSKRIPAKRKGISAN